MKRILCMVLSVTLLLSSCATSGSQNVSKTDNDSSQDQTSLTLSDYDYMVANKDSLNQSKDEKVLEKICYDIITEHHNAIKRKKEPDFSPFVDNKYLKEYLTLITKDPALGFDSNSEITEFELKNSKWYEKENYVFTEVVFSTQNSGLTVTLFVKNINGELRVTDWYMDSNISYDPDFRETLTETSSPDFWEDSEKANNVITKLKER